MTSLFSAEALLRDVMWQTTFWLLAGAAASLLWWRRPARAHRLLLLAVLAALATPLVSQAVRHLGWGLLPQPIPEPRQAQDSSPVPGRGEALAELQQTAISPPPKSDMQLRETPGGTDEASPLACAGLGPAGSGGEAEDRPSPSAGVWLLWAWAVLALAAGMRLAVAVARGRRLLSRARPVADPGLGRALDEAAAALGLRAAPVLVLSDEVRSPVIWCWGRRPVLVLPAGAPGSADGVDWASVLCHELAHWKRRDHLAGLAGEVLAALLPWHLLAWWAKRRLGQLCERACDDWVLASGRSPVRYAEALLGLVPQGRTGLALPAARSRKSLVNRIRHILDRRRREPAAGRRWTAAAALATAAAVGALALAQARPVAADEPGPAAAAPRAETPAWPDAVGEVTVRGRVLDPAGKPADKAPVAVVAFPADRVMIGHETERTGARVLGRGRTDAQGQYRMTVPLLSPRRYRLAALAGRPGTGTGWHFAPQNIPEGTSTVPEAVIRLAPEQVIRGRLIDLQGQPAAGVKLHVARLGHKDRPPHGLHSFHIHYVGSGGDDGTLTLLGVLTRAGAWESAHAALPWPAPVTTDAQGRFTLRGVGRGQGVGLLTGDDRFAFEALDVPPLTGDRADEVGLALAPARRVEGTVTAADTGKPIRGARVPEAALDCRQCHQLPDEFFAGDWKGRRWSFRSLAVNSHQWPDFLATDVRTDERGRYALNPFRPNFVSVAVRASAPDAEPYLAVTKFVTLPPGAARQELDFALPRAVVVRGKVTEQPSGQPVAGARVDFWAKSIKLPREVVAPEAVHTGPDGTFRMVLPPGRVHLLVNGPGQDYLFQKIPADQLREVQRDEVEVFPGEAKRPAQKPHYRPDAWVALDLKPGSGPREVAVTLRRATLRGKVLDPDGKPVARALIVRRAEAPDSRDVRSEEVRDGTFSFSVQDLEATYRLLFLDATNRNGAVAEFTGKQAQEGPVTVRLAPCGTAAARFVDAQGKPVAGYRPRLWARVPPGPFSAFANQKAEDILQQELAALLRAELRTAGTGPSPRAAGAIRADRADPLHYGAGPLTDAEGRCALPALIPGAAYRLVQPDGTARDFVAEPGKTVDLNVITVRPPPKDKPPRVIMPSK
jgi:beta-lactamase regulating signal transducer with metallopeptidase domain/protocatechuate 3,4-dioxygenase beta subunit